MIYIISQDSETKDLQKLKINKSEEKELSNHLI